MSECNVSEDPEDTGSGEEEDDFDELGVEQSTPEKRARHAITGRGVTLSMLMADGIIQSGEGLLSLEYLGQKFTADLLSNGKIKSNETEETFASPSSWAIYCKKLVNPAKKSGCGWASVKYRGRKLDSWKTSWFRLVKPRKPNIPDGQSPSLSDMGLSNDGMSSNLSETDNKIPESFQRSESGVPLLGTDSNMSPVKDLSVLRTEKDMSVHRTESDMSVHRTESEMSVLKDLSVHRTESDMSGLKDLSAHRTESDMSGLKDLSAHRTESDMSGLKDLSVHRTESDMSGLKDLSVHRTESDMSVLRTESDMSGLRTESDMSVVSNNTNIATEPSYIQDEVLDLTTKPKQEEKPTPVQTVSSKPAPDVCFMGEQEEALNLSLKTDPIPTTPLTQNLRPKPVVKQEVISEHSDFSSKKDRKIAKYSSLPERSPKVDLNMLVECEQFSSVNKIQPYTVSMSTNSLLLMDFHCHLTTSEVVGYLGGKWDPATQHLSIQQAFPCRCRLGDTQNARYVEEEIRATMRHLGMSLVGWFHSHPYCLPEPSIRDIECQMSYQLRMKGARNTYFPCVGIINSPYYGKSLRTESSIQMYMVMPPPDTTQSDYGIPMSLKYSVKQNQSISEDILAEMKRLVEFYRGDPDWITFQHSWHPGITYLEKLKTSLNNKLPEDQTVTASFLDFVHHVLTITPPTSQPQ